MVPVIDNYLAVVLEHDVVETDVAMKQTHFFCVLQRYKEALEYRPRKQAIDVPRKASRKASVYSFESLAVDRE